VENTASAGTTFFFSGIVGFLMMGSSGAVGIGILNG
jgi:hypothetical protein